VHVSPVASACSPAVLHNSIIPNAKNMVVGNISSDNPRPGRSIERFRNEGNLCLFVCKVHLHKAVSQRARASDQEAAASAGSVPELGNTNCLFCHDVLRMSHASYVAA
jgi:hypothetical protein